MNRVRDVFIFCSYTGLAYADVSALRKTHFVKLPDWTESIIKPREKTDNRMEENFTILDFELSAGDMETIWTLDQKQSAFLTTATRKW
ncbi:MAG: hypothetical protein LUD02_01565 [Tannerellaceae bacterium]|nr:hypothetical protein [Tannerellaceae bacterium]